MAKLVHVPSGCHIEGLNGSSEWFEVFSWDSKSIAKTLGIVEARRAIWIHFCKSKKGTYVYEKDFIEVK